MVLGAAIWRTAQHRLVTLSCMPLKPELDAIAATKSLEQLAGTVGRLQLATQGSGMMFGFGSDQDFGDATQVIAFAHAGGLGLPDRDYYTKTDAKSEDIRQKYVAHVQKMFELLGDSPETAAANAQKRISFLRFETRSQAHTETVKLGSYEENIGLKGKLPER